MQTFPTVGCCQAFKLSFINYAKFEGRSRRSEFWYFYLNIFIITLIVYFISFIVSINSNSKRNSNLPVLLFYGLLVFYLIIFIPSISLTVRRLHDTGRSGLFYFIIFIPFVGSFILLYFCCIDSEQGPNKYGPSPKYIPLQQNTLLNPNNNYVQPNIVVVPVNPYPQQNPIPPQVSPYPQQNPIPPQVAPYPQQNPIPPQVVPYPQQNQIPPQVAPYPQQNQIPPQVAPYPQQNFNQNTSTGQHIPPPQGFEPY